jgi:hypothetical protein
VLRIHWGKASIADYSLYFAIDEHLLPVPHNPPVTVPGDVSVLPSLFHNTLFSLNLT